MGGVLIKELMLLAQSIVYTPIQEYNMDKRFYHPLYGNPAVVERPYININTNFVAPNPDVERLRGDLSTHIVATPEYARLWDQQKRLSWYNDDLLTQLSPYQYRPIRGMQGNFLNGTTISSRDQRHIMPVKENKWTQAL